MLNRLARTLVLIVATFAVLALSAGHAGAQDDPYGATTTTSRPAAPRPSCTLRTTAAAAGSTAKVTVRAAPRGMSVRLLFDGEQVAQDTAEGPGTSTQVNFDMSFTVPDVEPGEHELTAVGADFTVRCTGPAGGGFEVLGEDRSRESGFTDSLPRRDGFGASLPRTGIYAALLIAVAIALLLGGRALVEPSRRRRRAARPSSAVDGQHKAPTSR